MSDPGITDNNPPKDLLATTMSTTRATDHATPTNTIWTSDKLEKFMVKMQLRLVDIIRSKPGEPGAYPQNAIFSDNLYGEMVRARPYLQ